MAFLKDENNDLIRSNSVDLEVFNVMTASVKNIYLSTGCTTTV